MKISQNRFQHEPVGRLRKIGLLLQRSLRYSYRQRCCGCLPTILIELFCSLSTIGILLLLRYGSVQVEDLGLFTNRTRSPFPPDLACSQELTPSWVSSNDLLKKCFKFPPVYFEFSSSTTFHITRIIFRPNTSETEELVLLANDFLSNLHCPTVRVTYVRLLRIRHTDEHVSRNRNANETEDDMYLSSEAVDFILIDFPATSNLKTDRQISCERTVLIFRPGHRLWSLDTMNVRKHGGVIKNDPVDLSFQYFDHPSKLNGHRNARVRRWWSISR